MNCTAITNEQIEQYVKLKIIVNGGKKIKQLGTIFGHISHSKKCWFVLTQFWVKYGQTRNVGLKM